MSVVEKVDWKRARHNGPSRWNEESAKSFIPGVPTSIPNLEEKELLDAVACK